jgi:stress-induced morphogen
MSVDPVMMEERLTATFQNCETAVIDMTGGGSNFEVRISTPDLKDLSRVERHQKIMAVFADELKSGVIHALTIKYI